MNFIIILEEANQKMVRIQIFKIKVEYEKKYFFTHFYGYFF